MTIIRFHIGTRNPVDARLVVGQNGALKVEVLTTHRDAAGAETKYWTFASGHCITVETVLARAVQQLTGEGVEIYLEGSL